MSQTYIPAALRRLVRERARDRCEYCLIPESMTFAPLTNVGRVTERLLQFNQSDRIAERAQHVAMGLLTTI